MRFAQTLGGPAGCLVLVAALAAGGPVGCSTTPQTESERQTLQEDAQTTLNRFKRENANFGEFLDRAHGYAIFPSIGKGAVGVGGAYGKGEVYQGGEMIGYADMTQATIGLQLGGQEYAEVILFETPVALAQFKGGEFAFDANASAVALKAGTSATISYKNGVAVFTKPKGGAMFEAALGGQKFSYRAK